MGALYFGIFMGIIFFVAMFCIILSVILLIVWSVRKKRGKPSKKRWLVIPIVVLVFNMIVALIPVGYVAFLRFVNTISAKEIVYAESGKELYWLNATCFEMDGTTYVRFREGFSYENFYLSPTEDRRGEPVANIRDNPASNSASSNAMLFLLSGSTSYGHFVETIYPIKNENDFEFFEVSGGMQGTLFCPESKLDSIKAYYADISNYDTQNLICEYSVYTDEESGSESLQIPLIDFEKNVTVLPEVFEELSQIPDSGQDKTHVEIPQKYYELAEAEQPGTPFYGCDVRNLYAYSKDKMAFRWITLELLEGQVYIVFQPNYYDIDGYPLSDTLNQHIIDTVFDTE